MKLDFPYLVFISFKEKIQRKSVLKFQEFSLKRFCLTNPIDYVNFIWM